MGTDQIKLTGPERISPSRTYDLWSGPQLLNWSRSLAPAKFLKRDASHQHDPSWPQLAGEHLARLAIALHPHAQTVWVCCGPGINGLDGWYAAQALHARGKSVMLSAQPNTPAGSFQSELDLKRLQETPPTWDLAIDAIYGIGLNRPIAANDLYGEWIAAMHGHASPILHVDLPSGLCPTTGRWLGPAVPTAKGPRHTLALLGMCVGLWTHAGQSISGQVWLSECQTLKPIQVEAQLLGIPGVPDRPINSHKGTFGHVIVAGGRPGMQGAALLAARSALTHGAGVVHWHDPSSSHNSIQSGLMDVRLLPIQTLAKWPDQMGPQDVVVAGCGAGVVAESFWHRLFRHSPALVLDADALNAVSLSASLAQALLWRHARKLQTVITPHPLEAARLLSCTTDAIQNDRLAAARKLSDRFQCVSVLKGSGTVIADPNGKCWINPTGNARLATAGSGDALAGHIGALMAQGLDALVAAQQAVHASGLAAERSTLPVGWPLTADHQAMGSLGV